jgi:DNA polymerase-3 subunit chi
MVLGNSIYFVETRSEEQRNLLCYWVERLFEKGMRVQVAAGSSMAAQHLDQLLWSFSQESFIPHIILTAQAPSSDITPVVITAGESRLEDFDALVCDGPVSLDFMKGYGMAVHFILLDDTDRRQESRMIWQSARDMGMTLYHVPFVERARLPETVEMRKGGA